MNAFLVMTVLAPDRPGIVQSLSQTVVEHGGNWLESRMARMAGHFAGIVRVECPAERIAELEAALHAIEGLSLQSRVEQVDPDLTRRILKIDVVGNDRPGIVRALSSAIAATGANLEELQTALESAPMAGHPLFHAHGTVALAEGQAPGDLIDAIEDLGEDLSVTVDE